MNVVRVTRHFNASPERVFDAWLDPKTAGKWLFATPSGQMVRVEIDARPGGRWILVDRRNGEDVEHSGGYLEIDRPRRLVFTFGVPKYSSEITEVTVEIEPAESGCDLTLTQTGVPDEYLESNEKGWIGILVGLAESLAEYIVENI
ncbi:MAG: SRPBCC family protein [Terracidiphilus sp.]